MTCRGGAVACLLLLGLLLQGAAPLFSEVPVRRWSTIERFAPERLAAAQADVAVLRSRVEPPAASGSLHDYRAIFHAHAADAAHTGGTLAEIRADARAAEVDVIFLSDHYRPPRDFMDGWRGLKDGVLFIPGSEARGFLLHPVSSIVPSMEANVATLLSATLKGAGMAFLSHIEDRPDHSLDHLTGMEIYNRHADAKDDARSMSKLVEWMTDPDGAARLEQSVRRFPAAIFAAQQDYPTDYLEKFDREWRRRRVVGVAGNDCHHNQVFLVKKIDETSVRVGTIVDDDEEMRVFTTQTRPRLGEMTAGKAPGDVLVRLDFDPYRVAMGNTSTHILAARLDEATIRAAVARGRVYVSHDWLADPSGFRFEALGPDGEVEAAMGQEADPRPGQTTRLSARFPLECRVRLLRDGVEIETRSTRHFEREVGFDEAAGKAFRVEGWLQVDGEWRPWIYSNPIRLGKQSSEE